TANCWRPEASTTWLMEMSLLLKLKPQPPMCCTAEPRGAHQGVHMPMTICQEAKPHQAGGRRGKERVARSRAEQRLAAGGRRLPRPVRTKEQSGYVAD